MVGRRWTRVQAQTGMGVLLLVALLFFEMFNYSTTAFALRDLLGELRFLRVPWAVWLAVAFCGIDFAGLARLFALPEDEDEREVWMLFGAWFLAATMNALLTWWGVSVALLTHRPLGTPLLGEALVQKVVPIFLAVQVWLTRILLIGSITLAGPRLFRRPVSQQGEQMKPMARPRPVTRVEPGQGTATLRVPEPRYEPVQARGRREGRMQRV